MLIKWTRVKMQSYLIDLVARSLHCVKSRKPPMGSIYSILRSQKRRVKVSIFPYELQRIYVSPVLHLCILTHTHFTQSINRTKTCFEDEKKNWSQHGYYAIYKLLLLPFSHSYCIPDLTRELYIQLWRDADLNGDLQDVMKLSISRFD